MNKATYLLTLPILEIEKGLDLGRAAGVLLNSSTQKVYLTLENGHPGQAKILDTADIEGVGEQYLLIKNKEVLKSVLEDTSISEMLKECYLLLGVEVVDASGTRLGEIQDLVFDEQYIISSLILNSGQELEAESILSVCHDRIFVSVEKAKEQRYVKPEYVKPEPVRPESAKQAPAKEEGAKAQAENGNATYVGFKMGKTVVSDDGKFRVEKGTVITEALMQEAERHNALLSIAMYAEE
ncbi:uncharacterized protein YrrD [Lachnospiraceae bacterium PF1-21]|uniref:PRC-barrel domain-containing protein n=1 Tax=Ohessyouella blattaphilus TaxID=2949333 RepID=A0ABT1ELZ1_9FIRM|nr:PRC-barrel domain-containing protein [Ohessyouella blattaphilus]MCP1111531.1 PRC-barrel domain-containing protein [Ohessyouella blattaphilus]MCR8564925.1 PRC-barrel domain-containing protein [Ohessyouella blattaphilus]